MGGMVKSTIRFPEQTVDEIEALVDEGTFESKSEFYRFASEYVLEQIAEEYEPTSMDYEDIKGELFAEEPLIEDAENEAGIPFLESVAMVRKFVIRGKVNDAEDFIDHHYSPGDRSALLLEELLD